MAYQYNPNLHVKIWLSDNPNVFMNLENQIRLIEMREKNPKDIIHLVYDSKLLTHQSIHEFHTFCKENAIILIDAHAIQKKLKSENECKLYEFYKDEIYNLKSGGNLGVASDILRWLSPIFKQGTYTDFDFPIDTSNLPSFINLDAPLLLNIGSFKMGRKEFILANNDFVAIVDEGAALNQIERVQRGILSKLVQYDTDFVERTENDLNAHSFLNRHLLKFMKNRSETLYISKSKTINLQSCPNSSLAIRSYINEIMSDKNNFLNFNKITKEESHPLVIKRLRKELQDQLNLIKCLFFNKEYSFVKHILEQDDDKFLDYLMKKERDLYLKSIVVCTTGPIEISNALFNGYVVDVDTFIKEVQPLSFNHYGLKKAFQSKNSIPLHENIFGMLKFLGVSDGELNDSSWLHSGKNLQALRTKQLAERQKELTLSLSYSFSIIKDHIETHIHKIANQPSYRIFFKGRNQARMSALKLLLACFNREENEFNISQFKNVLLDLHPYKKNACIHKLVKELEILCHEAIIFRLAKDKKVKLASPYNLSHQSYPLHTNTNTQSNKAI